MIIINVKEAGSIDKALRTYKKKSESVGYIKELRERKEFEKKSVKRRKTVNKAKYVEKKNRDN